MNGEIGRVPTIYIVDDDGDVRRALTRLICSEGWEAEAYASASEFLGRLPYEGGGCILLDVQMPGMTGPELHDALVRRGFSLPVVYLTGQADASTRASAMGRGALDILAKPADDLELINVVRKALAWHALIVTDDHKR